MLGGVAFAANVAPQFFGIANEDGSRVAKIGLAGRFLTKTWIANPDDLRGPEGLAGADGSPGAPGAKGDKGDQGD